MMVMKEGYVTNAAIDPGRSYDISPDDQRLLLVKAVTDPNAHPPEIIVVQHFDQELQRLVPTK